MRRHDPSPQGCRCGHIGEGDHPCHNSGYTCRKPATQRFYHTQMVGLTGFQMKFAAMDTWACDECWALFSSFLRSATIARTQADLDACVKTFIEQRDASLKGAKNHDRTT